MHRGSASAILKSEVIAKLCSLALSTRNGHFLSNRQRVPLYTHKKRSSLAANQLSPKNRKSRNFPTPELLLVL